MQDPYAPPQAETEAHLPYGTDSANLYIETLPSPVLRATGVAWLVAGILSLFLALRMMLSLRQTPVAVLLEGGQAALAFASFGVGAGLMRGQSLASVVGFALCPVGLGLSLFALLTGSLAGLVGIGVGLLTAGLTAATLKEVAKVGRARRALNARQAPGGVDSVS